MRNKTEVNRPESDGRDLIPWLLVFLAGGLVMAALIAGIDFLHNLIF